MKAAIVVGLFVLVACLQLEANCAEFSGRTDDCSQVPEGVANTCHRRDCDQQSGYYTVQTCGIASVVCPEGQQEVHPPEDLTKPYPECCSQPHCE